MSSILVTGANGYIGQQVAIALRTAGYRVYGLVRSQEKGAHLVRHEIIPVIGDITQPSTYEEALNKSFLVVDTVLDFTLKDPHSANQGLLDALVKSSESQGVIKSYIFTSGILVYPHSVDVRDETHPLFANHDLIKARMAFEATVLSQTKVRGIVLRPGFVYGGATGAGNHLATYFTPKEKLVIPNYLKDQRWSYIHVADLADAYVRAAKNTHAIKGEAFNIVSDSSPTYEQVVLATAKISGFKGEIEYTDEPGKDFLSTIAVKTVVLTHKKAQDLLGWTPNHIGVLEELDIYYHTIKGSY